MSETENENGNVKGPREHNIKFDTITVIRIALTVLAIVCAIMTIVFLVIDATDKCPGAGRWVWYCFGLMASIICVVAVWLNDFWVLSVFWILEFVLICTWREATKNCTSKLYKKVDKYFCVG